MNLVINAVDASPSAATVWINSGTRADGNFVSVIDEGPGVAAADRDRLFEPHFTTKENGTGMGLFVSYGIVREHHGRLLYEGDKRGAVFTVVLPPAPATAEPVPSARQA
jgi:signal transduction histidine kinase